MFAVDPTTGALTEVSGSPVATGREPLSVAFSPQQHSDDYAWDFDGSNSSSTDAGLATSVAHVFQTPGAYAVGLAQGQEGEEVEGFSRRARARNPRALLRYPAGSPITRRQCHETSRARPRPGFHRLDRR
jgi:hypothetical protein